MNRPAADRAEPAGGGGRAPFDVRWPGLGRNARLPAGRERRQLGSSSQASPFFQNMTAQTIACVTRLLGGGTAGANDKAPQRPPHDSGRDAAPCGEPVRSHEAPQSSDRVASNVQDGGLQQFSGHSVRQTDVAGRLQTLCERGIGGTTFLLEGSARSHGSVAFSHFCCPSAVFISFFLRQR